jgi:hypothetical protein
VILAMPTLSWLRQAAACVGLQWAKVIPFGARYKGKAEEKARTFKVYFDCVAVCFPLTVCWFVFS